MSRSVRSIPAAARRRLAGTLGLFAVLLVAVGAVALSGTGAALTAFAVVAMVAAAVVALIAWGLTSSLRDEAREQRLDSVLAQAAAGFGGCDCGHEHDPEELHVPDDPCAHDGAGSECSRSCDTCVLSRLHRTAANATVPSGADATADPVARADAAARRPSPTPR